MTPSECSINADYNCFHFQGFKDSVPNTLTERKAGIQRV